MPPSTRGLDILSLSGYQGEVNPTGCIFELASCAARIFLVRTDNHSRPGAICQNM